MTIEQIARRRAGEVARAWRILNREQVEIKTMELVSPDRRTMGLSWRCPGRAGAMDPDGVVRMHRLKIHGEDDRASTAKRETMAYGGVPYQPSHGLRRDFMGIDFRRDRVPNRVRWHRLGWQDACRYSVGNAMTVEHIYVAGGQSTTATALKAKIEMLQEEIAKLEALVAGHQAEFRAALAERDRAQQLMAELLCMTADLMSARDAAARLEGELTTLRSWRSSRPWWCRMLAC